MHFILLEEGEIDQSSLCCVRTQRRCLPAGQEGCPHQGLNLPAPGSWTLSLQKCEKYLLLKTPRLWHFVIGSLRLSDRLLRTRDEARR